MLTTAVIVLTSPGREENLRYCLKSLLLQTNLDFELLVVDDGSEFGRRVVAETWPHTYSYLWRANDFCMSRSYNQGVANTRAEQLVFLSSDIILNPHALAYYRAYYQRDSTLAVWGYFGSNKTECSASVFFAERMINRLDSRFGFNLSKDPICDPVMATHPQAFAWGGNWSVARSVFLELKGFDEGYQGWGSEDIDFANRMVKQGIRQAFSLDVWAEHQVHESLICEEQKQKNRLRVGSYAVPEHEPLLLYDPGKAELNNLLHRSA